MARTFNFSELESADLIVDAVYEGGDQKNFKADPLSKLMACGLQGGFRKVGSKRTRYAVLYTSLKEKDWPDEIDIYSGRFTYFGDNRTPGKQLLDTKQGGNRLLEQVFASLHTSGGDLGSIPPFFVFSKSPTINSGRSVKFRGLAVPGSPGLSSTEDLVSVWKADKGERFQNYRAVFTILDIPIIKRAWLSDLRADNPNSKNAPKPWSNWIQKKIYSALTSTPTTNIRTIKEQTPSSDLEKSLILCIYKHFNPNPTSFEYFAADILTMKYGDIIIDEVTRQVRDGGHDGVGRLRLGPINDPIHLSFHFEAKLYSPGVCGLKLNSINTEETSRLISRIRTHEFGVLVTTSMVSSQAYSEVRGDGHPIIFLCGIDIAKILIEKGYNTVDQLEELLLSKYPMT